MVLVWNVERLSPVVWRELVWRLLVWRVVAEIVDPTSEEWLTEFTVRALVHVRALLAPEVSTKLVGTRAGRDMSYP
jgi:hypothetical protein